MHLPSACHPASVVRGLLCLQAPAEVAVKVPPAPVVLQEDLTLPGVAANPAPPAAPVLATLQVWKGLLHAFLGEAACIVKLLSLGLRTS